MTDNLIKYRERLYHYALKLTKNHEDAEDLVQDAMLKAIEKMDMFDGKNMWGWMSTIMRRLHINKVIKYKHLKAIDINTIEFRYDHNIEVGIDAHIVAGVIADSKWREPLTLWLDGYMYKDIARDIGVPYGTLKDMLYNAKIDVRAKLLPK